MNPIIRSLLLLLLLPPLTAAASDAPREIDWMALMPPEAEMEKMLDELNLNNLSDDDPRAQALLEEWIKNAPVVPEMDGQNIKLPGFVVPLELENRTIREFLLVPYFGACIHVPPPPTNQVVYVQSPAGQPYQGGQFDTVWVSGTLRVEQFSSELGDAGYRLEASVIEPYTED